MNIWQSSQSTRSWILSSSRALIALQVRLETLSQSEPCSTPPLLSWLHWAVTTRSLVDPASTRRSCGGGGVPLWWLQDFMFVFCGGCGSVVFISYWPPCCTGAIRSLVWMRISISKSESWIWDWIHAASTEMWTLYGLQGWRENWVWKGRWFTIHSAFVSLSMITNSCTVYILGHPQWYKQQK